MREGLWVRPASQAEYWFDKTTWASQMTFFLLSGAVLLLALPSSRPIEDLTPASFEPAGAFPLIFVIFYGILALALGQAEADWRDRLSTAGQLVQLLGRQLLTLAITLPYWLILLMAHAQSPLLSGLVLLQLGIYGFMMGLFGWGLALLARSEVFRFNLKYSIFILYLVVSFLIPPLRLLSPYWAIVELLGGASIGEASGLLIQGPLVWGGVAASIGLWIRRRLALS